MMQKNKRRQWWKPHLKYPDPIQNRFWKTNIRARQYNALMTPRNNNMKSNQMQLTSQPKTLEMVAYLLPKEELRKLKNDL